MTAFVIAALGRGYLKLDEGAAPAAEARWTEDRGAATEWELRKEAEQQLRERQKAKGFPASAGVLPGPNV